METFQNGVNLKRFYKTKRTKTSDNMMITSTFPFNNIIYLTRSLKIILYKGGNSYSDLNLKTRLVIRNETGLGLD